MAITAANMKIGNDKAFLIKIISQWRFLPMVLPTNGLNR
jgi:hypothetical protein